MRKYLLLLLVLIVAFSSNLLAQKDALGSRDPSWPEIEQTGKIFTIRLQPGKVESRLSVEFVGRPAVEVKKDEVSVTATYGIGSTRRQLRVERTDNNEFVIKGPYAEKLDLQLQLKSSGQSESFPVKINKPQ